MESLLLQESGSGYFTLEDGSGRILLEISGGPEAVASSAGGIVEHMDERLLILRNDDEIAALVIALL